MTPTPITEHLGPSTTRPDSPATGGGASFTMADVHLVAAPGSHKSIGAGTGGGGSDEVAVPGFSLVVDRLGITVLKPGGGVGAVLEWTDLADVSTPGLTTGPDGVPALRFEVTSGTGKHRFLVPADYDGRLQAALAEVAPRQSTLERAPSPPPRRRGVLAWLGSRRSRGSPGAGPGRR